MMIPMIVRKIRLLHVEYWLLGIAYFLQIKGIAYQ